MSSQPSLALCMIIKNEKKNIGRLLESVNGCFDEIHITDTGSTDGSKEYIQSEGEKLAGCPVILHDFVWINDFSAARNYSLSFAKTDYLFWMDADDALLNKEHFIIWRKEAIHSGDFWIATYNYALDQNGKSLISFIRERCWKRSLGAKFTYRIHEGVIPQPGWKMNQVQGPGCWQINHMRDAADVVADKSRNIKILEEIKSTDKFDGRLAFYYGKELYENSEPFKALDAFTEALKMELQPHDRLLSFQYGAYSAMACGDLINPEAKAEKGKYFEKAKNFCLEGIILDPNRAEYWVALGDICIKQGNLPAGIPFYGAAKNCLNLKQMGITFEGAIYSFLDCYTVNPRIQLAKIKVHIGDLDGAMEEAQECMTKYPREDVQAIIDEIERIKGLVTLDNNQKETDDIVFTTPPQTPYVFDEELFEKRGMGGSETALISMAKELKAITGKNVKVFQMRDDNIIAPSGVEYLSNKALNQYLSQFRPKVHIAWRHNIELTKAKTYLWCHDLMTPTVESKQNFHRILCLSPFHAEYVKGIQGVSADKIQVTRNGILAKRLKFETKTKDQFKVVFMSSPDRGLDRAIKVMDEVIKEIPNATLHIYYGFDHFYRHGLGHLAEFYRAMIQDRPYIVYHGFTEQSKMHYEVSDASVWLYPTDFLETSCITAMEMLALKVYPVTRSHGALKNTLAEAKSKGWASLLDHDCVTDEEVKNYTKETIDALKCKAYERIEFNPDLCDWSEVAKEWVNFMEI